MRWLVTVPLSYASTSWNPLDLNRLQQGLLYLSRKGNTPTVQKFVYRTVYFSDTHSTVTVRPSGL